MKYKDPWDLENVIKMSRARRFRREHAQDTLGNFPIRAKYGVSVT